LAARLGCAVGSFLQPDRPVARIAEVVDCEPLAMHWIGAMT